MASGGNYSIQAQQAKRHFLSYGQEKLAAKLKLKMDDDYLYTSLLGQPYRIHRQTGDLQKQEATDWVDANTFEEVMTLLDLVCDSREDRQLTGRWKTMQSFGLQFHQNLLEEKRDPWAERFQEDPEGLRRACLALGGIPVPGADIGYAIELFDGLRIGIQFWLGDEEFAPRLRYLWDENALQCLRYETMYFAVPLLLARLRTGM